MHPSALLLLAGPVRLLTHPPAAGYIQNPISVYYCFAGGPNAAPKTGPKTAETLEKCIIEVTNTPWGERVTFVINPTRPGEEGEAVPKSLHVSPLMDMKNTWWVLALLAKGGTFSPLCRINGINWQNIN